MTPEIIYGGINVDLVRGVEFVEVRGVQPSILSIRTTPKSSAVTSSGTLEIRFPGVSPIIKNKVAAFPSTLRYRKGTSAWAWSIIVKDRRWMWPNFLLNGEFNARKPDGTLVSGEKTAREIADYILEELEESGASTSSMPSEVYPYFNWKATGADKGLGDLLERTGSELAFTASDAVKIWELNDGNPLPTSSRARNPEFRLRPSNRPEAIEVFGGRIGVQKKFTLEAIGLETDGSIIAIDDLSYTPSGGWAQSWYLNFTDVDDDKRHLAHKSVFRWYRVVVESFSVSGLGVSVSELKQILPINPYLLETHEDAVAGERLGAVIKGTYWPQGDLALNTEDDTVYEGPFTIDCATAIVKFDHPVIKFNSHSVEPADLNLYTSFYVKDEDDKYVRFSRKKDISGGVSGAGVHAVRRPELFYGIMESDSEVYGGIENNKSAAEAEADAYISFEQRKFANEREISPIEYESIFPIMLDGIRAQVKYQWGTDRETLTTASEYFEFDAHYQSEHQRRTERLVAAADERFEDLF